MVTFYCYIKLLLLILSDKNTSIFIGARCELGDLVAEGMLHSDDLSLRAVVEVQREEYLRLSKEWDKQMEEYLNSVDWEELKTQSQLATEEEEIF